MAVTHLARNEEKQEIDQWPEAVWRLVLTRRICVQSLVAQLAHDIRDPRSPGTDRSGQGGIVLESVSPRTSRQRPEPSTVEPSVTLNLLYFR